MRSMAPTRFADGGHEGLLVRNGSKRRRTPFGDVITKVECPSQVTLRPCSARRVTELASADGSRIAANYPLKTWLPKAKAPTRWRCRRAPHRHRRSDGGRRESMP